MDAYENVPSHLGCHLFGLRSTYEPRHSKLAGALEGEAGLAVLRIEDLQTVGLLIAVNCFPRRIDDLASGY